MFVRYVVRVDGFDGLSFERHVDGRTLRCALILTVALVQTGTGTTMNYFSSLLKKKWNDARSWNFLKQDVSQQD
jgi:hypothetical protein